MTNAAAGWYDDGAGQQRWWDGARWTEHTALLPTQHQGTQPVQQVDAVVPAGWYDDGTGRKRWWDGQSWGSYDISTGIPLAGGGIEVQIRSAWPLWFVLRSDPHDPRFVRGRVYAGFDPSTPPPFDAPNPLGDIEIDDWEGAPLDMIVHSSQHERMASLGPEMVEILRGVSHQVQAAIDRLEGS